MSNRVVLRKADGTPVLFKTQSDTPAPRFDIGPPAVPLAAMEALSDRSIVPGSDLFLKRKFLTTTNAKNFALGALCVQQDYIDERDERVSFPPLFPASLISCALLERGVNHGHDFQSHPMVYTSHQISVDMRVQERLRSNDRLHLLVTPPEDIPPGKGLGKVCVDQQLFRCIGLRGNDTPLFEARVQLAPLQALVETKDQRHVP